MPDVAALPWWKSRVVYQVYPLSFKDTNCDGYGDIAGITEGLKQIKELGAGIVWLSPIFVTPLADNGYDMSDYRAIDPRFGTMEDFDRLLQGAQELDLKIVLDIALNHTSIQHPWFQAALKDPKGPYRDYYHWRDSPNNWQSIFGGPAWSQPSGDTQFYLHLFDRTQADLNWENPKVRAEIFSAMRFWLDKGVAGFRLDVVTVVSKPDGLPDAPDPRPGPLYHLLAGGPRLHEWLRDMRREVFRHYDCVAIGEGPGLTPERAALIVDPSDPMLDMIYHFDLVPSMANKPGAAWDRVWFKAVFDRWNKGIGTRGWNSCVVGNHDLRRLVARFGDPEAFQIESAKALAAVCLLQRATPFIYQGDELGLGDSDFSSLDELNDVWAKTTYQLARDSGLEHEAAFARTVHMTRDHARTPYPWSELGGFSESTPWLKGGRSDGWRNLAAQTKDPHSVRAFYKQLIGLRATNPDIWVSGTYEDHLPADPALYWFSRGRDVHVVINLTSHQQDMPAELRSIKARGDLRLTAGAVSTDHLGPWAVMIVESSTALKAVTDSHRPQ